MQIMQYVSIMYFCFFLNFFVLSQIYKSFSKTKHNCRHVMDCISKNDLSPTSAPSSASHPSTVHRAHHVHNDTKRPRNAVATAVSSFATVISLHVYSLFIFSLFKVYTCKYLPYVCPMRSHVKEKYIKISISLFCNLDGEC